MKVSGKRIVSLALLAILVALAYVRPWARLAGRRGASIEEALTQGSMSGDGGAFARAVLRHDVAGVSALLDRGVSPNLASDTEPPPLVLACQAGDLAIVRLLLEHHADPNKSDSNGETPLLMAAGLERTDIVRLLIQQGAKVNVRDRRGNTPLTSVLSAEGSAELVDELMRNGASLAARGTDNRTPLSAAAAGNSPAMLDKLLKAGAPFGTAEARDAMESAITFNKVQNLGVLLRHGADVNARNVYGLTLLMQFVGGSGRDKCLELLMKNGADVNAVDNDGYSALRIAREHQQYERMEMLLKAGAVDAPKSPPGGR